MPALYTSNLCDLEEWVASIRIEGVAVCLSVISTVDNTFVLPPLCILNLAVTSVLYVLSEGK